MKKPTKRSIRSGGLALLLIVAMQPVPISAQQAAFPQQAPNSYDLWLVRSQTITADLIKDSADLTASERALLWARLAENWWRDDPEKARSWMLKPIEIVEAIPNKENADERRERLSLVRLLLKIVAPLDQKLSARLVAILTTETEQEAKSAPSANTDGLIQAATFLVEKDPQRAAELGALAFRVGHPTDITSLLWRLRSKDANLANSLFAQALAAARQPLDGHLLGSLLSAVFPEYYTMGFTPGSPVVTENMRTELLKVYVVYLQSSQINAENRDSCMGVVSIAPVLAEFDRRLPQQAIIVRQSISQCQSMAPLTRQRLDDALRNQPLNTIDELLKAADDAGDMKVRTVYQFRAASLATQQGDYDRALKILDSMSSESREFMSGAWENMRWDWAATAALHHLKSGDIQGMRLIIIAVPTDLQPFAKIALIDRLPADRNKDTDPTLEFLSDARTGLRRTSVSSEDPSWYFALLKLTVKYQPTDATAVLKEAITAINHADEAEAKRTDHDDRTWFSGSEVLSASLLEIDDYAVREAVSSISAVHTRVQVRLELLRVCLDQLRSSKPATPNKRRAA